MNKTVYFLGAGFSKPAGGPIQNEIIKTILSLPFKDHYKSNSHLVKALEKFISFLKNDLNINPVNFTSVELEDIFTPIDRCIADNKSFGNYGIHALAVLREEIHLLMAAAIQYLVDQPGNNRDYIRKFAAYINQVAQSRINDNKDKLAVITSNWDILLDNELQEAIDSNIIKCKLAVVDYCCYISSLQDDPKIKPGLFALGQGGYNIKVLKLHGSTNWLHCPMCQRMYIVFNDKPMLREKYHCTHCKRNYKINDRVAIQLKGNLLVPTFLKDLSNIQIKLVWQNAGIELCEASKIVFIGYSLPAADFEIRQLLSRSIPKQTDIEVIVYPHDSSKDALKVRYEHFFGARHINFIEKEVPDYIDDICK